MYVSEKTSISGVTLLEPTAEIVSLAETGVTAIAPRSAIAPITVFFITI